MGINSHVIRSTIVGSLGGLLFGFDTAVISGTTSALTSTYGLSPASLGITVSIALWGTVLGALTAGYPGQRWGRRDSLRVMAVMYVISAFGCAIAWNLLALDVFRFIGGIAIGGSSVLGPMYIAEIAPPLWRGRLVGFFQTNIVVGILLAYLSNLAIRTLNLGSMEWRLQLGVSGIPALLFLIALFFIPRSPRWLVMKGRSSEALEVLTLIGVENSWSLLAKIQRAVSEERQAAGTSILKMRYRLPIFVASSVGAFSQLSGINAVLYYLNDIFSLSGASQISGDFQTVAVGGMNLVATLLAMSVIDKIGRKKLLLIGTIALCMCLATIAWVFATHRHQHLLVWLLMAYIASFAISQGATLWVYISEVFPTNVRAKGQSLGSSSHWITNAIVTIIFPIMSRKSASLPFVLFAAMMLLDFFLVLFIFPETSGRSLETLQHELDAHSLV